MGAKTVEVRNFDSPVARQVLKDTTSGREITLSHGYGKKNRLAGRLGRVAMVASAEHLPQWVKDGAAVDFSKPSKFFDGSAKIVAFEVELEFNVVAEG